MKTKKMIGLWICPVLIGAIMGVVIMMRSPAPALAQNSPALNLTTPLEKLPSPKITKGNNIGTVKPKDTVKISDSSSSPSKSVKVAGRIHLAEPKKGTETYSTSYTARHSIPIPMSSAQRAEMRASYEQTESLLKEATLALASDNPKLAEQLYMRATEISKRSIQRLNEISGSDFSLKNAREDLVLLGDIYMAKEDYKKAAETYDTFIHNHGSASMIEVKQIRAHLKAGNFAQAKEYYEIYIEKMTQYSYPKDRASYPADNSESLEVALDYVTAWEYTRYGDPVKSTEYFQKVLKVYPNKADILFQIGEYYHGFAYYNKDMSLKSEALKYYARAATCTDSPISKRAMNQMTIWPKEVREPVLAKAKIEMKQLVKEATMRRTF
jgi:tetratricopeptide (TPR) repeat protein